VHLRIKLAIREKLLQAADLLDPFTFKPHNRHTQTHTHTHTMDENTSQGLKRLNDEIGIQDSAVNMESTTPDSNASKRSKVDSVEIEHATEDDMATTGQGTHKRRNARAYDMCC
jgi:hypothetical protein